MHSRRESGFSAVEALLLLAVVGLVAGAGVWVHARQKARPGNAVQEDSQRVDDAKPVLQNLGGIYLAAYNKSTGLAGDLKFDSNLLNPPKGIEIATTLFGQSLAHMGQPDRLNPNLDFRGLARQVDVLAAIDGKVLFVHERPTGKEYEVTLAKTDNGAWLVSYDHVTDLQIKRGDRVVTGQALGRAAPYRSGTYYYQLQVAHKTSATGDVIEYVCPTTLLNPDVRPAYVEGMNLFVRDWITFRTKDTYGAQDGGCVEQTLKPKQVDG
jgi:hypothetical protein